MYDFRMLSPIDFELLVRDLLQAEFNITMESFGPGKDSGIDFRYAVADHGIVVQVKHHVEGGAGVCFGLLPMKIGRSKDWRQVGTYLLRQPRLHQRLKEKSYKRCHPLP